MKISHAGTDIHAVLDEFAAAHAAHDAESLFALYSGDMVWYSLAPPLQQGPATRYGTLDGIRAWFAGFDGPVQITHHDPVVHQDGDLAFAHTLSEMTATPTGQSESISTWFRSTFGLHRIDGSWHITHRPPTCSLELQGVPCIDPIPHSHLAAVGRSNS